jgi:hypothetical protein
MHISNLIVPEIQFKFSSLKNEKSFLVEKHFRSFCSSQLSNKNEQDCGSLRPRAEREVMP